MSSFWAAAESLAERGAVQLGILAPEEAGAGEELPCSQLIPRFTTEACAFKDAPQSGFLFVCQGPKVIDGRVVSGGPEAATIQSTLERWLVRLQKEDGATRPAAIDALLQSKALDIVLKELPNSKDGRDAIRAAAGLAKAKDGKDDLRAAAESPAGNVAPTPLRLVLKIVSAVPDGLLGQLLRIFTDIAEDEGSGSQKLALQWILRLMHASTQDPNEAVLRRVGRPVEAKLLAQADIAMFADGTEAGAPTEVEEDWDRQLDGAKSLGSLFMELKAVCEDLQKKEAKKETKKESKKESKRRKKDIEQTVFNASPAESLAAARNSLAAFRTESVPQDSGVPARVQVTFAELAAASQEIETLLEHRIERTEAIRNGLPELPKQREEIAAVCLDSEKVRRHLFEVVLSGLEKTLWSDSAVALQGNRARLEGLKKIMARAHGLFEQAWRDVVSIAAYALDEQNAIGANSEEMTNYGKRYKEMKQELEKHLGRRGKLEAGEVKATPAPKPVPAPTHKKWTPNRSATAAASVTKASSGSVSSSAGETLPKPVSNVDGEISVPATAAARKNLIEKQISTTGAHNTMSPSMQAKQPDADCVDQDSSSVQDKMPAQATTHTKDASLVASSETVDSQVVSTAENLLPVVAFDGIHSGNSRRFNLQPSVGSWLIPLPFEVPQEEMG